MLDVCNYRKSNKFAKQLGKLSPLIALVLLISLLGTLAFHTTKVSRLGREAIAAQSNVQATRGELLQSQVSIFMITARSWNKLG